MDFKIGDKIIYPNHGLGIVERIEEKTIFGTPCGFYQLRIIANDTLVMVPLNNVDGVGLRRVISSEECEELFSLLGNGHVDSHANWKGRFKNNSDKMRSGSIYEVVGVLKNLAMLSRTKSLSFREKRMLDRAKFLVISEIAEVMKEPIAVVEQKVDRALDRCVSNKARQAARAQAKATKPAPARVTATEGRRLSRA